MLKLRLWGYSGWSLALQRWRGLLLVGKLPLITLSLFSGNCSWWPGIIPPAILISVNRCILVRIWQNSGFESAFLLLLFKLDLVWILICSFMLIDIMFHCPICEILLWILDQSLGIWINVWSEIHTLDIFIFLFILQLSSILVLYLFVIVHSLSSGARRFKCIIIEVLKFRIIHLTTSRVYNRSECRWRFFFDPPHFLWLFTIIKIVFSIGAEIVEFLIEVIDLLVRKAESWPIY